MNSIRYIGVLFIFILNAIVWSPGHADQNDPRLDPLFERLKAAEVFSAARQTEAEIWEIWLELPDRLSVTTAMDLGLAAMRVSDFPTAVAAFDEAVRLAPDFAEAWNKRATVFYLMGDYRRSIEDVQRTLALEPRHFGALSGLGLINLALDRKRDALNAFEAALKVHPFLPARFQIDDLREAVEGEKL